MAKRLKKGEKRSILDLGMRERQVYEAVLRVGEGSVNDVVGAIENPPTYTTVRVTLGELVKKGLLKYRNIKNRYYYKATESAEATRRSALADILGGLFNGRASDVALTLLEVAGESIPTEELDRLSAVIERAKQERRENDGENNSAADSATETDGENDDSSTRKGA